MTSWRKALIHGREVHCKQQMFYDFKYLHDSLKKKKKVAQLCPTLHNPMDGSRPGSSVHGIFQSRVLEWVAISSPEDLPDPGIKPRFPTLQADALPSEPPGKPE